MSVISIYCDGRDSVTLFKMAYFDGYDHVLSTADQHLDAQAQEEPLYEQDWEHLNCNEVISKH